LVWNIHAGVRVAQATAAQNIKSTNLTFGDKMNQRVHSVAFGAGGVMGACRSSIVVLEGEETLVARRVSLGLGPKESLTKADMSPDGKLILAMLSKSVELREGVSGKKLWSPPSMSNGGHVAFAPNGKLFAVQKHFLGSIEIWQIAD
jgi:hypothetical protein